MDIFHPAFVLVFRFALAQSFTKLRIDQNEKFDALHIQAFHLGRLAYHQSQVMNLKSTDLRHIRSPRMFCKSLSESWSHGYTAATLERLNALSKHTLQSLNQPHGRGLIYG